MSGRIAIPVNADTSAASARPADGPSLALHLQVRNMGHQFHQNVMLQYLIHQHEYELQSSRSSNRFFHHITERTCRNEFTFTFTAATSIVSNSPPTEVQAKPFYTTGLALSSSATPKSNLCGPRYSGRFAEVTSTCKF